MDLGKITDKAKEWAGKNPDKADGYVEKGEDFVNSKFGGHEGQVDTAGDKAKGFLHGDQPPQGGAAPAAARRAAPAAPRTSSHVGTTGRARPPQTHDSAGGQARPSSSSRIARTTASSRRLSTPSTSSRWSHSSSTGRSDAWPASVCRR